MQSTGYVYAFVCSYGPFSRFVSPEIEPLRFGIATVVCTELCSRLQWPTTGQLSAGLQARLEAVEYVLLVSLTR
jgi:hypothetical protein